MTQRRNIFATYTNIMSVTVSKTGECYEQDIDEAFREGAPPFFTDTEREQGEKFTDLFNDSSALLERFLPPRTTRETFRNPPVLPSLLDIIFLVEGVETAQRVDAEWNKAWSGGHSTSEIDAMTLPLDYRAMGGFHQSVLDWDVLDRHGSAYRQAEEILRQVLESRDDAFERLSKGVRERLVAVGKAYRYEESPSDFSEETERRMMRVWGRDPRGGALPFLRGLDDPFNERLLDCSWGVESGLVYCGECVACLRRLD